MHFWRWLQLPWFLLRLGKEVLSTLFTLVWLSIAPHRLVLICLIFFLSVFILNFFPLSPTLFERFRPLPQPTQDTTKIDQQIQYWEKLKSLQPTHRDVLYNLSLLYAAKNEPSKAQEYWEQARQQDPNHPLFQSPPNFSN